MGLLSGKVLAVIIIIILILAFLGWVAATIMATAAGGLGAGLLVFIPGAVVFGFWYLVISALWNCDKPEAEHSE